MVLGPGLFNHEGRPSEKTSASLPSLHTIGVQTAPDGVTEACAGAKPNVEPVLNRRCLNGIRQSPLALSSSKDAEEVRIEVLEEVNND